MGPKDADGMANSVVWVYTDCPDLSVQMFRIMWLICEHPSTVFWNHHDQQLNMPCAGVRPARIKICQKIELWFKGYDKIKTELPGCPISLKHTGSSIQVWYDSPMAL